MSVAIDLFKTNKKPVSDQKLRGGYYTPQPLASYLAEWAIRSTKEHILEPSSGDGNFLLAAMERIADFAKNSKANGGSITAVEIDQIEISKARLRVTQQFPRIAKHIKYYNQSFFDFYTDAQKKRKFDVIIGNPPFIRFQHFSDDERDKAFKHLKQVGYKPTKLANAWAAFLQLSIEMLDNGGRMAFVVPAELLQVGYAKELRDRLTSSFEHIILVTFKKLVFPEIQQEVVLLLAEGKRTPNCKVSDVHTIEVKDGSELIGISLEQAIKHAPAKHANKEMKWTSLLLSCPAYSALEKIQKLDGLQKLGALGDVDVGIVTGRNSFFLLSEKQMHSLSCLKHVQKVVGKTSALRSINFSEEDFEQYQSRHPAYLLDLKKTDILPKKLQDYVKQGEAEGVHLGYKCSTRKRWFDVPSIHTPPDAFLFRQIHHAPLLVANNCAANTTDTIHRFRKFDNINLDLLCATFVNSVTFAWAEIVGRSYGGGVLELEPSEAENLLIPYFKDAPALKRSATHMVSVCCYGKSVCSSLPR